MPRGGEAERFRWVYASTGFSRQPAVDARIGPEISQTVLVSSTLLQIESFSHLSWRVTRRHTFTHVERHLACGGRARKKEEKTVPNVSYVQMKKMCVQPVPKRSVKHEAKHVLNCAPCPFAATSAPSRTYPGRLAFQGILVGLDFVVRTPSPCQPRHIWAD